MIDFLILNLHFFNVFLNSSGLPMPEKIKYSLFNLNVLIFVGIYFALKIFKLGFIFIRNFLNSSLFFSPFKKATS